MDKSKLGIVYVLSNPAMPGIVKIGRSDQKDLKQRLRSLFNTSVPLPFKVEFACYVEKADTKNLEAALHSAFADKRVHEKREFFRVQKEQVIPILQFCNKGEATKHVSHQLSTLDESAEAESSLVSEDVKAELLHEPKCESANSVQDIQALCNASFYRFNGEGKYSKSEIARKVVHLYQEKNPRLMSDDLIKFYGIGKIKESLLIPQKRKDERRYATEDEIRTSDGKTMLITTQWSYKNFKVVIENAIALGVCIEAFEDSDDSRAKGSSKAEIQKTANKRKSDRIASEQDLQVFINAVDVHMTCKGVRVDAKYDPISKSILLVKGSHISIGVVEKYKSKRDRQIKDYLENQDESGALKYDVIFETVSGAAVFISGNDVNGWDAWKTNNEQTINNVYRK